MTQEYRITANNITPPTVDDCVLPEDDAAREIARMQFLGGLGNLARLTKYQDQPQGSNISVTGTEKAELMKKHDIEPGTDAWFRLWFSLPFLTGEKPIDPPDNE
jgi:hypothetical protein